MNYFGHAALAAEHRPDALFVLGAMLPDLAGMLRSPCPRSSEGRLRAGLAFHHATDAVFHVCPSFVALNLEGCQALRQAGVGRGPARATAHLVTEMLLDAYLAEEPLRAELYLEALRLGSAPETVLVWERIEDAEGFRGLTAHLHGHGAGLHRAEPEHLVRRVARTLQGRSRIEPNAAELAKIGVWAAEHARFVFDRADQLLGELRAGLRALGTPGR